MDPLADAGRPECPDDGTVLRDDPRGLICGGCGRLYMVRVPEAT